MRSTSLRLALVLAAAACGSSDEKPVREPRGAAAYSGKRQVQTEDLGTAVDGALLAASDGAERALSSFHDRGPALVVFYRGHW